GGRGGNRVPGGGRRVLARGGVEGVVDLLPSSAGGDQVGQFEHREMVRKGRLAHVEVPGQLPRRHLAAPQQTQDAPPRRVRQGLECLVRVHRNGPCLDISTTV